MLDEIGCTDIGAYRLIIVISFLCISSFISMECPSLSHLINVSLQSTFSEISIVIPACFQGPWAWSICFQTFTPSQCLFLSMRSVSCKQQIVGSSFLIQFAKQYLLMAFLSPLTFSVNIDRCVVILVI
jgi:hypothetical protein